MIVDDFAAIRAAMRDGSILGDALEASAAARRPAPAPEPVTRSARSLGGSPLVMVDVVIPWRAPVRSPLEVDPIPPGELARIAVLRAHMREFEGELNTPELRARVAHRLAELTAAGL